MHELYAFWGGSTQHERTIVKLCTNSLRGFGAGLAESEPGKKEWMVTELI